VGGELRDEVSLPLLGLRVRALEVRRREKHQMQLVVASYHYFLRSSLTPFSFSSFAV
jgi:hypothetical protein